MKRIAVALVGAFLGVNAYAGFMYQSELTVSGYTGETALSERSMLSAPPTPVFAATGAALRDSAVFEQADSKDDARSVIQVWSYDPGVIGADGVDGYSLYLSLKDVNDPRVQGELEDMMEKMKRTES